MILYDRLEAALRELPATASGVATYLQDHGITGVRDECTACPVARWLRVHLHVPVASVDVSGITVTDDQDNFAATDAPMSVVNFIAEFDIGHAYPDLVDENGMTDEEMWSHDSGDTDV